MIASVWDWPSLKYVYFVIESQRLDAGGWSPTRGIVSNDKSISTELVAFDDILPDLPKDCYFAGVGDFCVGELFAKRDPESRERIDLDKMASEGTPQEVKVVELIRDKSSSVLGLVRENSKSLPSNGTKNERDTTIPRYIETEVTQPHDPSVWSKLVPVIASFGIGYFLYKRLDKLEDSNLAIKDILFSWGTGLAIGLTIGQEAVRKKVVRKRV
jgi:hypothetical protein